jgi:hypothetical protein
MAPLFDEIRASDLASWADRVESDRVLHSIVQHLVLASGAKLRECRFLTHEEVNTSGWDGLVLAESSGLNVPAGASAWELSKKRDVVDKAGQDIADRSAAPGDVTIADTTYVAVTVRRWPVSSIGGKRQSSGDYKRAWAADQQRAYGWRAVQVLDAVDLAAWIASVPGAGIWVAQLMGHHVNGAKSLVLHWDELATIRAGLNPSVFLAGRQGLVSELDRWITGRPQPLEVRTWAPEDLIDAISAWFALKRRDPNWLVSSIPVAVYSSEAWIQLSSSNRPLLLVAAEDLELRTEQISMAIAGGHYVLYRTEAAGGRAVGTAPLPPLARDQLAEELCKVGIDNSQAWRMATQAGGSGVVLKRILLGHGPAPEWASASEAKKIAPVVLIGSWDAGVEGDRQTVEAIFGEPYSCVEERLNEWVKRNDPLMRQVGTTWRVINREDAWRWLAPVLAQEHLVSYETRAVAVLSEVDPRYSLPADERIFATIKGAVPRHTYRLKRSLSETLCLLALRPRDETSAAADCTVARRIVQKALAEATTWERWESFGESLLFISEAAPDIFLEAVERDLGSPSPAIAQLFQSDGESLFAGIPQTHLMWALEGLLWKPRWASAAAGVLAKLAKIDPGGNTSPRPLGVLRDAFLPWLPQTCLSVEDRCKVLDSLASATPDVAWQLFMKLLPRIREVASPTHTPTYSETPVTSRKGVTPEEYWKVVNHAANHLIQLAGGSSEKWSSLIATLDQLPGPVLDSALCSIEEASSKWDHSQRVQIWNALRREVAKHRFFVQAKWRMSDATVAKIEKLGEALKPANALDRTAWLFSGYSVHASSATSEIDFDEQRRMLKAERIEALKEIARGGLDSLRAFALKVNEPAIVGYLTAECKILLEDTNVLPHWLCGADEKLKIFARAYFSARFNAEGCKWLDALNPNDWGSQAWAELTQVVPFGSETWQRLQKWGQEFVEGYWAQVGPSAQNVTSSDLELGLNELIARGRVAAAVRLLDSARFEKNLKVKIDTPLRLLEKVVSQRDAGCELIDPYQLSELFSSVQEFPSLTNDQADRVERLEWQLFPAMKQYIAPKFLHRRILSDPGFFVSLLQMRPWTDESAPTERKPTPEQVRQYDSARDLLDSIHRLPAQANDGTLDYPAFLSWVEKARELAGDAGYGSTCERYIGEIVVHSPSDSDDRWPTRDICKFLSEACDNRARDAFRAALFNHQGWPPALVGDRMTSDMSVRREAVTTLRSLADKLTVEYPRVAEILRTVADEEEHFINYRPRGDDE